MIIRLLASALLLTCAFSDDPASVSASASVTPVQTTIPPNNNTATPDQNTQPSVNGSTSSPVIVTNQSLDNSTDATDNGTDTAGTNETTTTKPNVPSSPAPTAKPDNNSTSTIAASTINPNETVSVPLTKAPDNATESPNTTSTAGPVATTTTQSVIVTGSTAESSTAKPENVTESSNSTVTPHNVTGSNLSTTTEAVTEQPVSTAASTTAINTDTSEAAKVTVPPKTNTSVTTSAQPPKTTPSTTTTIATSPKAPSTTHAPIQVYINEIMIDNKGMFQKIELHVVSSLGLNVSNYVMVMVDGANSKMTFRYLKDFTTKQNSSLFMISFNTTSGDVTLPSVQATGTGVAIYQMDLMTSTTLDQHWTLTSEGLVDALVIGKKYEDISSSLVKMLTPNVYPFVLDPSIYGGKLTISRCSMDMSRSTDMYALVNPSIGDDNKDKCAHRQDNSDPLALKFAADCSVLKTANGTVKTRRMNEVMRFVMKEVNSKCQCGLTVMHVNDWKVHCCGGVSITMRIGAPTQNQEKEFTKNYKQFIETASDIKLNKKSYKLDNSCTKDCCLPPPDKQTGDDSSKNVRTTVAVIVTLLGIFMIIVVVVVMYMRRKKKAVYQFRMSRLEEEDDDMIVDGRHSYHDEFVGGQEATFDTNS